MVFIVMDTNKSTSRRQGRLREEGSGGSPVANVRGDGQKPHRRLSPWASWHNTTKPIGSWGRVNAAFVHGKLTFLSGEVCATCDRRSMRGGRNRFNRVTKYPAYPMAVDGYESLPPRPTATPPCKKAGSGKETQNRQRLIIFPVAPFMETCGVSAQKSAEGIVVVRRRPERRNECGESMSSRTAMNPTGGAEL